MQHFSLTQDLLTGIPAIDEQHGELLDLANEVVDASGSRLHPDLLNLAATFLAGYAAYYFAAEEWVMTDLNYPQRSEHFDHHRRLQREVAAHVAEVRVNRSCEACKNEIALFLENWIVHHIRVVDREMAEFLRTRTIDLSTLRLPASTAGARS
jgi:hemerythrin-like metal-binding protein